ncbi:hypothetical protein QTP86_029621 [Hemibagrus guttatus]|nr:hypothetical protein QTP86_029621 [Hemibagrus guttatus]
MRQPLPIVQKSFRSRKTRRGARNTERQQGGGARSKARQVGGVRSKTRQVRGARSKVRQVGGARNKARPVGGARNKARPVGGARNKARPVGGARGTAARPEGPKRHPQPSRRAERRPQPSRRAERRPPTSSRVERRPPTSSRAKRRPPTRSRTERRPQPGWAEKPQREGGRDPGAAGNLLRRRDVGAASSTEKQRRSDAPHEDRGGASTGEEEEKKEKGFRPEIPSADDKMGAASSTEKQRWSHAPPRRTDVERVPEILSADKRWERRSLRRNRGGATPSTGTDAEQMSEKKKEGRGKNRAGNRRSREKYPHETAPRILFSNGENWKEMRRFSLTTLRDFGMGKRGSEEKIIEETCYLRKVFEEFQGKPFDTSQPLNYATSNVISAIVYGSRFQYSDPEFKDMVNRANEIIKLGGSASIQIYNMFPWLGSWLKDWKLIMKKREQNLKQIKELVNNLEETLNVEETRGLVDSFLIRKKNAEKAGEKDTLFHEQNLIITVSNLFAAGTDTTSTTLRWCLLLMAKYPQIQDRVQEEIDSVIGVRQPRVEHRKNLPYTDAVIHETQRIANIVPMSLPHTTTCDIKFQGFFIKKGTCVFPLLTSVLKDETQWTSPLTFNPAHFLDEQGRFVKKDAFMPFSAGRRVCLGESLARMELFLFFTSLLQHFRFTPPPGVSEDQLDLTPAVGITLNPSPHKLCAVSRASHIYS